MTKIGKFSVEVNYLFDKKGREITLAHVYGFDNKLISSGRITRNSKDTPCKKTAFKKVLKQALTGSSLSKRERAKFWESFRTMTKTPRWTTKQTENTYEKDAKISQDEFRTKYSTTQAAV